MATTNDLKNGMTLDLDGAAVERRRVPARQARQGRRLRPHQAQERADRARSSTRRSTPGVKVDTATVDKREMQYLYREGDDFVFMDTDTFDQIPVAGDDGRRRAPTTCSRT